MARQTLSDEAVEKSTYVITLTCTDAAGAAVTPTSGTWTLTTLDGTVVNSRTAVALTPASTMDVVLSNADLALLNAYDTGERLLTAQFVYSSDEGSNLTLKEECYFQIRALAAVS
jgi:hypothetical protein